jgi:hypothetical protein
MSPLEEPSHGRRVSETTPAHGFLQSHQLSEKKTKEEKNHQGAKNKTKVRKLHWFRQEGTEEPPFYLSREFWC